jgi:hypothetical protein
MAPLIRTNPNGSHEIELIHPGGERRWLPIEAIHANYVTIRWGMSGHYDIDLRTNTMRAHSLAARRKNPLCLWKAVDLASVKALVREHFRDTTEEERKALYDRHHQQMPYAKRNMR